MAKCEIVSERYLLGKIQVQIALWCKDGESEATRRSSQLEHIDAFTIEV